MSGTLFIVGTPIGNLKDITLRALEVLKECDVIACEDTRHSLALLNHYQIKAHLIACHKFNEEESCCKIIDIINEGKKVAIISDAGMPCISDPGARVVAECRKQGIKIEVIPGATALASAVALSGINCAGFTFLGFLPEKKKDKVRILSKYVQSTLPLVLYCAPHDVVKTAADLLEVLGDREVYVVRELTKVHECVEQTTLADFKCAERGEIVLIVGGVEEAENPLNDLGVEGHFMYYMKEGFARKDAIKQVASDRGVPRNEIYQQVMDL